MQANRPTSTTRQAQRPKKLRQRAALPSIARYLGGGSTTEAYSAPRGLFRTLFRTYSAPLSSTLFRTP